MKEISMSMREYSVFQRLANVLEIKFDFRIRKGTILITADIVQLEHIGY